MFKIKLIFSLLFMISGTTSTTDFYIIESQNVLFFCPPNKTASVFEVLFTMSGDTATLARCENVCTANSGVTLVNDTNGYNVSIQISDLNQLRNVSKVHCRYDKQFLNYTVHVIVPPINASCENPTLTADNLNVSIRCKAAKVYPQALCSINTRNKTMIYGYVNYTHTRLPGTPEYYQTDCTWTSPLSNFEAGSFTFDIVLYPNNTNDTRFWKPVMPLTVLELTVPNVTLSNDCFNGPDIVDGYIRQGANVICTCYLKDIGYPAGQVKWLSNKAGNNDNSTATQLKISPSNDSQQFICTAITTLKNGNRSIYYNVSYARGPNVCFIKPEHTIANRCDNNVISINTSCEVQKSNVVPAVNMTFYVNGSKVSNSIGNMIENDNFQANLYINLTTPGYFSFKCHSENSKFNDLTAECNQTVEIREPPNDAPVFKINNFEKVAVVQENQQYSIKCSSYGGLPEVSNVSFVCGNSSISTQTGNELTDSFTFTRNMNGKMCTCIAEHITGCYERNTSKILLNVTYFSAVTNFNTQINTSLFDNGSITELYCEADGNPPPKINILKGNRILYQNSGGHKLSANITLTCSDTGKYLCEAENGVLSKTQLDKFIYVKCPLHFSNLDETFSNFSETLGANFYSIIDIDGYPEPSSFTLFKFDVHSNADNEIILTKLSDHQFSNTNNKIFVKYSTVELPIGTIEIKIQNLSMSDFTNYTLFALQNGFQKLEYNFILKQDNSTTINNIVIRNADDDVLLNGVIGGIAAAVVLIFIVIIGLFLYNKGHCKSYKRFQRDDLKKCTSLDLDNLDVYFTQRKMKDTPNMTKLVQSEMFKNYNDIVPTITTATAVPKNMYKPQVKPKSKVKNSTTYYNFVEPLVLGGLDISDKKDLLDENVYANQGFN